MASRDFHGKRFSYRCHPLMDNRIKQAAGLRQCKHRGRGTMGGVFLLHVIAYDMVRLGNILKAKVAVV